MKKHILLSIFSLTCLIVGFGQIYITHPDDLTTNISGTTVEINKPNTEYLIYADMRIVNNTGASVELKFRRVRNVAAGNNGMGSPFVDQLCYGEECTNADNVTDYVWPSTLVVANGEEILFKPQIINIFEDVFEAEHFYEVMDVSDNVLATVTVELKTFNTASVNEFSLDFSTIQVFPNPAKENFGVKLPQNIKVNLQISDALGKQVKQIDNYGGGNINISNLKNGVYFVNMRNEEMGLSETRKLIIRK